MLAQDSLFDPVIPGRHEVASPESITPTRGYGFRACALMAHPGMTTQVLAMLQIDHITVAADSLRAGVAHAEAALGVTIPFGGVHPLMGTHNHLLRLGDTLFLEIIAPDPAAGALSRRRWFALDDAKQRAELALSPRLATWVVATSDIEASLRQVPHAAGPAITVTRGDLAWLISVPPDEVDRSPRPWRIDPSKFLPCSTVLPAGARIEELTRYGVRRRVRCQRDYRSSQT